MAYLKAKTVNKGLKHSRNKMHAKQSFSFMAINIATMLILYLPQFLLAITIKCVNMANYNYNYQISWYAYISKE